MDYLRFPIVLTFMLYIVCYLYIHSKFWQDRKNSKKIFPTKFKEQLEWIKERKNHPDSYYKKLKIAKFLQRLFIICFLILFITSIILSNND